MSGAACKIIICTNDAGALGFSIRTFLASQYWSYRASMIGSTPVSRKSHDYTYMTDNGCGRSDISDAVESLGDSVNYLQGWLTNNFNRSITSMAINPPSNINGTLSQQLSDYSEQMSYLGPELKIAVEDAAEVYIDGQSVPYEIDVFAEVFSSVGITNVEDVITVVNLAESRCGFINQQIKDY